MGLRIFRVDASEMHPKKRKEVMCLVGSTRMKPALSQKDYIYTYYFTSLRIMYIAALRII